MWYSSKHSPIYNISLARTVTCVANLPNNPPWPNDHPLFTDSTPSTHSAVPITYFICSPVLPDYMMWKTVNLRVPIVCYDLLTCFSLLLDFSPFQSIATTSILQRSMCSTLWMTSDHWLLCSSPLPSHTTWIDREIRIICSYILLYRPLIACSVPLYSLIVRYNLNLTSLDDFNPMYASCLYIAVFPPIPSTHNMSRILTKQGTFICFDLLPYLYLFVAYSSHRSHAATAILQLSTTPTQCYFPALSLMCPPTITFLTTCMVDSHRMFYSSLRLFYPNLAYSLYFRPIDQLLQPHSCSAWGSNCVWHPISHWYLNTRIQHISTASHPRWRDRTKLCPSSFYRHHDHPIRLSHPHIRWCMEDFRSFIHTST